MIRKAAAAASPVLRARQPALHARQTSADWGWLAAGATAVLTVTALLARNLRPSLEAKYYANDIRGAMDETESHFQAIGRFAETREHSAAIRRQVERMGL